MSKLIRVPRGHCRRCERESCQRPPVRTPPPSRTRASISNDHERLSKSSAVLSIPGSARRLASSNQRAGSCDKEVLHQPRITRQGSTVSVNRQLHLAKDGPTDVVSDCITFEGLRNTLLPPFLYPLSYLSLSYPIVFSMYVTCK